MKTNSNPVNVYPNDTCNQRKGDRPNPPRPFEVDPFSKMRRDAAGTLYPARDSYTSPSKAELATLQTAKVKSRREDRFKRNKHGDLNVYRAKLQS